MSAIAVILMTTPTATSKDALVTPDYPLYQKFAKLSRQEEDWDC